MAVPESIRRVERPKNTVVVGYKNGTYAVRERTGCTYKIDETGKQHRVPVEGKIIGYIRNNKYVAKIDAKQMSANSHVDVKDWANVYLCNQENEDLLDDLRKVYQNGDAEWMYCEAIIRACYPGTRDYELKYRYEESFLSNMYPGIPFSKDTVSEKTRLLGRQRNTFYAFMKLRIDMLSEDDLLIIDGSLKEDGSDEIYIAEVSRKTAKTGTKQHTIMYAYSFEKQEPVAQKCFPGNMIDSRSIKDFVKTFDIKKGMLVADRGFRPEAVIDALAGREDLGYLIPLERDRKIVTQYKMYQMDATISIDNYYISCHKTRLIDTDNTPLNIWLYSYLDPKIAADEECLYLQKHNESLDPKEYEEAKRNFGIIVFQSNYDLDLREIYDIYGGRWQIETMFKFHKTSLDEDDTRMHSDHSAVGSGFIDYLSTIMGTRMLHYFRRNPGFKKMTYRAAIEELRRCRKVRIDDGEWEVERMTVKRTKLMTLLELITSPDDESLKININKDPYNEKPKRGRGRPKGSKDSRQRKRRTKKEMTGNS